jgi:hypothetical protein
VGRASAASREAAGILIVATTTVIVAASIIAAGVGTGSRWVFEIVAAVGLLVGIGAVFGVFDRGLPRPDRRGRPGTRVPQLTGELVATVEAKLGLLDAVEHRRFDLGAPWPVVVVGPTGIRIVAVADRVRSAPLAGLRRVLDVTQDVVAALPDHRPIGVSALLVVPDAEALLAPVGEVEVIGASDLTDRLTRGSIVPMATVTAAFAHLSGGLVPDLHLDAV